MKKQFLKTKPLVVLTSIIMAFSSCRNRNENTQGQGESSGSAYEQGGTTDSVGQGATPTDTTPSDVTKPDSLKNNKNNNNKTTTPGNNKATPQ